MGIDVSSMRARGISGAKIRKLASAIKAKQNKFADAMGKFKLWDRGGDILSTIIKLLPIPGSRIIGEGVNLAVDQIGKARHISDLDASDISHLESADTGTGYVDEMQTMIKEAKGSFGADLLDTAANIAIGEATAKAKSLLPEGEEYVFGGGGKDASWNPKDWFKKDGGYISKYEHGGKVGGETIPTIADYFNRQNKTLGGSDKITLLEMIEKGRT